VDSTRGSHRSVGPRRTWLYSAIAGGLVLFGVASIFSIGAPVLLTGVVMLACFPWRHRREVLWPALAGIWGLTLGYVLVAALGCSTTPFEPGFEPRDEVTRCSGVLLDYSGGSGYDAPLLPAVLVGLGVAAASAAVARTVILRRHRRAGTANADSG